MIRPMVTLLWRVLAVTSLVLGLIGVVLPGLPTVPFLLISAWAASRGWPRLERWLLEHPRHGPVIQRWRDHGAVPRNAKWFASGMMMVSAGVFSVTPAPHWAKFALPAFMLLVAIWLWMRPEK